MERGAIDDLRRFGVPEDQLAGLEAAAEESGKAYAIWRSNHEALRLFLALATQWRRAGELAMLTGFDYAAIEPAARLANIELTPTLFDELRIMEAAALEASAQANAEARERIIAQARTTGARQ